MLQGWFDAGLALGVRLKQMPQPMSMIVVIMTDRPTDWPTDRQTDRRSGHREVRISTMNVDTGGSLNIVFFSKNFRKSATSPSPAFGCYLLKKKLSADRSDCTLAFR